MATKYKLAPPFRWTFLNKVAQPAISGYILCWKASSHSTPKLAYQDQAGTLPYPLDPITGYEKIPLDSGAGVNAIYFADDEPYFVELYDAVGSKLAEADDYPESTSITPPATVNDSTNYILNGQFRYLNNNVYVDERVDVSANLDVSPYYIFGNSLYGGGGAGKIVFYKSNATATDYCTLKKFLPGENLVEANAEYYIKHECTSIGAGETHKRYLFIVGDVNAFEGKHIIAAIAGISPMSAVLKIYYRKYYGSGGSATEDVLLSTNTIQLTTSWAKHNIESDVPIPLSTGKTIGTGNYFAIIVDLPLAQSLDLSFTNVQCNLSEVEVPYQHQTAEQSLSILKSVQLPDLSQGNYFDTIGDVLALTPGYTTKTLSYRPEPPVGSVVDWPVDFDMCPSGWLPWGAGGVYATSIYPRLYNLFTKNRTINSIYGLGDSCYYTSLVGDTINITNTVAGACTAIADVNTGFTLSVVTPGGPGVVQTSRIVCKAASTFVHGAHFNYFTTTGSYTVVMCKNYHYISPGPHTAIPVFYFEGETASQIAARVGLAMSPIVFAFPVFLGMSPRLTALGSGNDPDRLTRTARGDGTVGDAVGTTQHWQLESHLHPIPNVGQNSGTGVAAGAWDIAPPTPPIAKSTSLTGGNQTNPINYNTNKIIKY
jgi:hypothetical protein